jgi:1-deoxy-D-xylulose-5-phosphate synthase
MIEDAAHHRIVVTAEDGYRDGGIGAAIRDLVEAQGTGTQVQVLGVPTVYIPHGPPDRILARFGLDAAGIEAEARRLL